MQQAAGIDPKRLNNSVTRTVKSFVAMLIALSISAEAQQQGSPLTGERQRPGF
jgi:hypothetical protein